jgi:hypothetical protein
MFTCPAWAGSPTDNPMAKASSKHVRVAILPKTGGTALRKCTGEHRSDEKERREEFMFMGDGGRDCGRNSVNRTGY